MTNCTHRSLKKLEMPYLRQKLGFLGSIDGERVTAKVDFGYNDKVLVGEWQERRRKDIVNREFDLRTQYMVDYTQKSADRDVNSAWDNRLYGQGLIQLNEEEDEDAPTRMATVYDLAYRCRVKDFVTGDYGNVTNYGKRECLQEMWNAQLVTKGGFVFTQSTKTNSHLHLASATSSANR